MASRTLQIEIIGDPSSFTRATRKVSADAKRMGSDVEKSGGRIRGFATVTSKGMGRVGLAAGGMAAAGAGAATLLAKSFVSGATSINESLSKNEELFGKHAGSVDRWSKTTADKMGISRQAALEAAGTFGNLFVALEIGPRKSAGMSKALTQLAGDLASFNNASPDEALEAIRSGLVGETEPLRRFGVNINDAALRTQALKDGLVKTTKEALTPQQKALAVQALLFKQTEKAQGDFARTSGGLANQQRILKARLADAGAEIGGKLMPFALKAVKALNSLFDESSRGGRLIRQVGEAYVKYLGWMRGALQDAIQAVKRFTNRNREDIAQVVETFRRLGRFARNVFENVLVPIVERALPVIKGVMDGIKDALRGMIRVVTGIINGDWKRVWEGVKDIARGAVKVMQSIYRGLWRGLRDSIKALVPLAARAAVTVGKAIGEGILAGAKSALTGGGGGGLADQILDNIPGLGLARKVGRGIGDGVGKKILPPLPAGGGTGLMGADPDLAPFAAIGARFGLRVSDGLRAPGTRTSSGGISLHSTGDAIDMSGPASGMMQFARTMASRFGSRLSELIYSPMGFSIKDGKRTAPYAVADHYDHVHLAYEGPFGDGPGRRLRTGDGIGQAVQAAKAAGFRGQALINAVAIAGAESRYDAEALNPVPPDYSVGMWQINMLAHGSKYGNEQQLKNPLTNAKAAFKISGGGRNFGPWSTWPTAASDWTARARAAVAGGGGGAPGASGGGGSTAGSGQRGAHQRAQREARGQVRQAEGTAREAFREERAAARELPAARLGVRRAKAEARDDLSGLIKVMQDERKAKRRRLRAIRKVLKRRINKKRRLRLLNEEAELIAEIGDLNESIKEYKADQAGGATTISRADELDAGVDSSAGETGAGGEAGGGAAEPDPNIAILAGLVAEQVENQRRILALAQQGPGILAAVVAAVNGDLGGRVGLGFSSTGYAPGAVAAY